MFKCINYSHMLINCCFNLKFYDDKSLLYHIG
nr:MAG TPA: hypothetical protein [Caudoviricetes sp.]